MRTGGSGLCALLGCSSGLTLLEKVGRAASSSKLIHFHCSEFKGECQDTRLRNIALVT